jgi:hypothetical protein
MSSCTNSLAGFFVWLIKGRNFMIDKAIERINGTADAKESVWKEG